MRSLDDLIDRQNPGLRTLRAWAAAASNDVLILPGDRPAGERNLLTLQVTTASHLGAVAYETGGLLVDGGWVRIVGAGSPRLPRTLLDWNGLVEGHKPRLEGGILVGDDVVGGFFAMNVGGLDGPPGNIFYLAPDTLVWEDLAFTYSDWMQWACFGEMDTYYGGMRWEGWKQDVAALPADRAFSFVPPLYTEAESIDARTRRAVPLDELWILNAFELPAQLGLRGQSSRE